ncbi:unnamed protein product [Musa textilis]
MKAKESSFTPGAAALPETKDGPVSDEGHPLHAESLAKEAAFLFQSCRLRDCLHVLNRLLQKKQDDPKEKDNFYDIGKRALLSCLSAFLPSGCATLLDDRPNDVSGAGG